MRPLPLTRRQKLKLYSAGICPRLNRLLIIYEFPMTWIERHLEALATRCLKKCSGMTRPTNHNILHIPRANGSLNLPAIYTLYKKRLVSKQCQILTANDPTMKDMAEKNQESEMSSIITEKFKPAIEEQQAMVEDPPRNRRALSMAARSRVT